MTVRRSEDNPLNYDRPHDYVAHVIKVLNPRPIPTRRRTVTLWAIRKAYPEIGQLLASIATDAVLIWQDAHGKQGNR